MSATVWLVWDIAITMDQEINLIWSTQWTLPKFLYLAARYYGLFNTLFNTIVTIYPTLSVPFCSVWSWFVGFSGAVFFTTTVNLILLLRLRALYHRSPKVVIFLTALYIIEFLTEVAVTVLTLKDVHMSPKPPGLPLTGCYSSKPPRLTLISWIPCLVIACIFFAFTLYQFFRVLQDENYRVGFSVLRNSKRLGPVMSLFVRDGAVFFGLIFAVILINTVFNVVGGVLTSAGSPWLMAAYSIAGSRLILNIRDGFSRDSDGGASTTRLDMGGQTGMKGRSRDGNFAMSTLKFSEEGSMRQPEA
jgi:hypothetical protein